MGDDDLGLVAYGEKQGTMFLGVDPSTTRNYSESIAKEIDEFVLLTIKEQYERAKGILKKQHKKLDELAKILLEKETMSLEEFEEVYSGKKSKKVNK